MAAADGDAAAIEFEPPETARDAIDQGLVLCKQQRCGIYLFEPLEYCMCSHHMLVIDRPTPRWAELCCVCRWADALAVFEKGLNLPGTGIKRFR